MEYTWIQIAWLFFIYSLVGWIAEVCLAAINKRKFVNRGFVNGPFCPIYGTAAVLFVLFLSDLTNNLFFLFLGGMVIATVLEYITGLILQKIFHQKLWDYSGIRWNLDGYICARYSVLWGLFAVLLMLFANPFLCSLTGLIPDLLSRILLLALTVLMVLDLISTGLAVLGMQKEAARFAQFSESMQRTSSLIENVLTRRIQARMMKSFPIDRASLILGKSEKLKKADSPKVFAYGCSFYKLVSLFFIGAFLGDITETIFCLVTTGTLMSRSSVVYGPFSIVWGLACAMLTALLYRYKDKSDRYIFVAGTILGGAYEYICSVFTELVFGTVFWDYSSFTFNLGGRINLLYCFFWGIAAVVWLKLIYPRLSTLIEKMPVRFGAVLCNCMIVFMVFNMIISCLALNRYTERNTPSGNTETLSTSQDAAVPASGAAASLNDFLDRHFDDERMARIYPNAKIVVDGVPQKIVP